MATLLRKMAVGNPRIIYIIQIDQLMVGTCEIMLESQITKYIFHTFCHDGWNTKYVNECFWLECVSINRQFLWYLNNFEWPNVAIPPAAPKPSAKSL